MSTQGCQLLVRAQDRSDETALVSSPAELPQLPIVTAGTCSEGKGDCSDTKVCDVYGCQRSL